MRFNRQEHNASNRSDYDWADEGLHARIGRDWFVKEIGDRDQAIALRDQTWVRITGNWNRVIEEGLTEH